MTVHMYDIPNPAPNFHFRELLAGFAFFGCTLSLVFDWVLNEARLAIPLGLASVLCFVYLMGVTTLEYHHPPKDQVWDAKIMYGLEELKMRGKRLKDPWRMNDFRDVPIKIVDIPHNAAEEEVPEYVNVIEIGHVHEQSSSDVDEVPAEIKKVQ